MKPVAYEFRHPNGHAIVDYTEHTHVGHLTAAKGYTATALMQAEPLVTAAAEASAILRAMYLDPWAYRGYPSIERLREAFDKLNAALEGNDAAQLDVDHELDEFDAWVRSKGPLCPSGRFIPSAREAWVERAERGSSGTAGVLGSPGQPK